MPAIRARVVQDDGAALDVQNRQGTAGEMCRRQVATVGAQHEHPDVAIAAGLEAGDLVVVGDAADLDRSVKEPECVAGHGGIEGEHERALRKRDVSPGRFQIGQCQAGDRFVAQRIESLARQVKVLDDRGRPGRARQGRRIAAPFAGRTDPRVLAPAQRQGVAHSRRSCARSMRLLSATARWFLSR